MVMYANISPKMVNPRALAGNAEEEEESAKYFQAVMGLEAMSGLVITDCFLFADTCGLSSTNVSCSSVAA